MTTPIELTVRVIEQIEGLGKMLYACTLNVSFPQAIEPSIGTSITVSARLQSAAQVAPIVITQFIPVERIQLNEVTQLKEVDFEGVLYLGETEIDFATLTTSASLYYVQE